MKHVYSISRRPRTAQTQPVSLAALFTLAADILFAIGTAVVAKENSEFPDFTPPPTSGGS